ncbi:class I SAM-dependent methyltransferase [Pacificimonas sp. ICDLI1SI03]
MRVTADELRSFYSTREGRRTARLIARIVAPAVIDGPERRFLALGYPAPLLTGLDPKRFERLALLWPKEQGGRCWPQRGNKNCAVTGDLAELPFSGALFDQALIVHALEHGQPDQILEELHRVLAPAGELILIVPNRAGLWTHFERTPFGLGHPYGRGELTRLLARQGFVPKSWKTALVAPPITGLRWLDAPLTRAVPKLGGVHFVLARKSDGPIAVPVSQRRRATRHAPASAVAAAGRATP